MNVGCSFDMKGGAVGLYVRPSALHSINREPRNNRPARLLIPPACLPACLPFCVAVGNYEIELLEKQGQLMVRVFLCGVAAAELCVERGAPAARTGDQSLPARAAHFRALTGCLAACRMLRRTTNAS